MNVNLLNTFSTGFENAQAERLKQLNSQLRKKAESKDERTKEDIALEKSCREFEAIFTGMMYKAMRKTVPDNPYLPRSNAEKIFEDMLYDEIAKDGAEKQSVGLAKTLYEQLKKRAKSDVIKSK